MSFQQLKEKFVLHRIDWKSGTNLLTLILLGTAASITYLFQRWVNLRIEAQTLGSNTSSQILEAILDSVVFAGFLFLTYYLYKYAYDTNTDNQTGTALSYFIQFHIVKDLLFLTSTAIVYHFKGSLTETQNFGPPTRVDALVSYEMLQGVFVTMVIILMSKGIMMRLKDNISSNSWLVIASLALSAIVLSVAYVLQFLIAYVVKFPFGLV